jgi:hypothetical protein
MEATNLKNGLGLISVNDLVLNLDKKKELAQIFMKSGLIPNQLNTPEKVLVCMFKAQELGLPPLEGLSGMAVINGKTTLQGNLILALINRSNKAKKIVVEEHENYCSVIMSRRDYDFEYTFTFSMDDAKKAGLLDKQIWRQYPKTMLKWRAVSGCARVVFSDVIGGLYTPEEIISISEGMEAKVDEEGNIELLGDPETQRYTGSGDTNTVHGDEVSESEAVEYSGKENWGKESSKSKEIIHEAIEKIKKGSFWNGKVYKENTVYLDDNKFQLTSAQLAKFLRTWSEVQNSKDVTEKGKEKEDLPF